MVCLGELFLSDVVSVVMDEADSLLDSSFWDEVSGIIHQIRQRYENRHKLYREMKEKLELGQVVDLPSPSPSPSPSLADGDVDVDVDSEESASESEGEGALDEERKRLREEEEEEEDNEEEEEEEVEEEENELQEEEEEEEEEEGDERDDNYDEDLNDEDDEMEDDGEGEEEGEEKEKADDDVSAPRPPPPSPGAVLTPPTMVQFVFVAATLSRNLVRYLDTYHPHSAKLVTSELHRGVTSVRHTFCHLVGSQKHQQLFDLLTSSVENHYVPNMEKRDGRSHTSTIGYALNRNFGQIGEGSLRGKWKEFSREYFDAHERKGERRRIEEREGEGEGEEEREGEELVRVPRTIIFCNTISSCRSLEYELREWGMRPSHYHSEMVCVCV